MRRTVAVTAALSAAASIALLAPAATAAPAGHPDRLTATASCDGGGQIKVVSSLDAAGVQHVKATVSGVKQQKWAGEVMPGFDMEAASDTTIGDITSGVHKYVAKHGGFTGSAELANSHTLNALVLFMSHGLGTTCAASPIQQGMKYGAVGMADGLMVRFGAKPAVAAFTMAKRHHRYRVAFTVRTKAGVQHRTVVRTAKHGEVAVVLHDVKRLPSFTRASVTITDLAKPKAPVSFTLQR